MKTEKRMKWQPIEGIPQTLYLYNLKYDCKNLIINLYDKDLNSPILNINFGDFLAFRIMDEGNFLKEPCEIDEAVTKMQLEPGSFQRWTLFTIDNSRYLRWFHEESAGIYADLEIVHYLIATQDDMIDVLSTKIADNPVVKKI